MAHLSDWFFMAYAGAFLWCLLPQHLPWPQETLGHWHGTLLLFVKHRQHARLQGGPVLCPLELTIQRDKGGIQTHWDTQRTV